MAEAKLRAAVVGLGFIGPAHVEAIQRCGLARVEAVVSRSLEKGKAFAERWGIPRVYTSLDDLLRDGGIDAVHNCTPNALHYGINKKVLEAGIHLFSEKPLTMTAKEAKDLVELARKKGVVAAVMYNYRMFPLVIEAKRMIEGGKLGRIFAVEAEYLQDWLIYDTDYNWRLEPEMAGPTRAVGDIGTHAADLLQYLTGKHITEVMARMTTVHPVRKKPKGEVVTFAQQGAQEYEEVRVTTEDYATMLITLEGGIPGAITVSQVTAGKKNGLHVRIDGQEGSIEWFQEDPNRLYIGRRSGPNEVLMRDPSLVSRETASFIFYPGGHEEGFPDAFKNACIDFYSCILDRNRRQLVATLYDGYVENAFVEAVVESHQKNRWVKVAL
jgi:predicted dehydrogenase